MSDLGTLLPLSSSPRWMRSLYKPDTYFDGQNYWRFNFTRRNEKDMCYWQVATQFRDHDNQRGITNIIGRGVYHFKNFGEWRRAVNHHKIHPEEFIALLILAQ